MLSLILSTRCFRYPRRNPILNSPVAFRVRFNSSSREPSLEQNAVVEALRDSNVIVSARAGSGKTSTAKAVVAANPDSSILMLTYSKKLRDETHEKLKGRPKTHVYTFHSFAGKLFQDAGIVNDDCRLRELRARAAPPVLVSPYEIIILDEVQDMTAILYWLTCVLMKSLRSLPKPPKLLLLGDPRQEIYGYQGADPRYIEFGPELFSDYNPYSWQKLDLAKSFRLSYENASFVNTVVGEEYIEGSRGGPRPIYIRCNPWDSKGLAKEIHPMIEKYSAENCAIIAPFVKAHGPLAALTNYLSTHHGVRVAEPTFDDGPLDPDVLHGKLAISTYHQFKGLEREFVNVLGADSAYHLYIDRKVREGCPNPIYVAFTRARTQLMVIQSHLESALPCVPLVKLMDTCDLVDIPYVNRNPSPPEKKPMPVTKITRNIASEKMEQLVKKYAIKKQVAGPLPRSLWIDIPTKVLTDQRVKNYESVSDLSGIAITAAFEWSISGTCSTFGKPDGFGPPFPPTNEQLSPWWFAEQSANHSAKISHYTPRVRELTRSRSYGWLFEYLPKTNARLLEQFPNTSALAFEQPISLQVEHGSGPTSFQYPDIQGQLDILESRSIEGGSPTIWEIKLVSSLSEEHFAQVIIYGFLWFAQKSTESRKQLTFPRLVLFNVRDGTKWEIVTTFDDAATFTREILRVKNTRDEEISDETFLEMCRQVREEVAGVGTG